ncbi:hypothetical protein SAMN05421876_106109 [Kaistella jeonii]|nr:hypothetical protein SAMN05421876_106109 [Kaistella jeonii]VEI95234.1 Uncharacterised protein [Kaistella jeonii]
MYSMESKKVYSYDQSSSKKQQWKFENPNKNWS